MDCHFALELTTLCPRKTPHQPPGAVSSCGSGPEPSWPRPCLGVTHSLGGQRSRHRMDLADPRRQAQPRTGTLPSSLLWGPPSSSPEGVSALPRGRREGRERRRLRESSPGPEGLQKLERDPIVIFRGSRKKTELRVSWPLPPPPQPLPVPLRSLPGSFPPGHIQRGWLCSHPQLPGNLDLLGRVACHLSCWGRGGGFRTRWGRGRGEVHLAEKEPGRGSRERVPVGSSRFLASPVPPPQQDWAEGQPGRLSR